MRRLVHDDGITKIIFIMRNSTHRIKYHINNRNRLFYPRLFESSLISKYYQKKFGIEPSYKEHKYEDTLSSEDENVVAKINHTPIVKNPKSFEGFDSDVRVIIDKMGNMYVAKYDKLFNHGMMANALVSAGEINTFWYNHDAKFSKDIHGIYEDQENFLLLNRLYNTNKIIQSDTFVWEGRKTERLIKRLKMKHPQFQFHLRYNIEDMP